MGKKWKWCQISFNWAPKSLWTVTAAMKLEDACSLGGKLKAMTNINSVLKSRHYFANKCPYSQSYGFFSSHVWMWELDHKEGWALKNWCFWTVVLEKTLESPLHSKEIKSVNPKGNQSWIFIGRTVAEAAILWHLMRRADSLRKPLMLGKTEGERRGWQRMRWLNGIIDFMGMSWVSSGSWWWTGRPGVLQSTGWQRVRHDWATELHWTELNWFPPTLNPRHWLQEQLEWILIHWWHHEICKTNFNPWGLPSSLL